MGKQSFVDDEGRSWLIAITAPDVKRIRQVLEIDLLGVLDGDQDVLERLVTDPVMLVDVLFLCCEEEAKGRGVSDVEFGRSLRGDAIDKATNAFLESLADFFPPARRQVLRKAIGKMAEVDRKLADRINSILDGPTIDEQLERFVTDKEEELRRRLTPSESTTTSPTSQPTPDRATGGVCSSSSAALPDAALPSG